MTPPLEWQLREAGASDAERLALIGAATFLETFAGVLEGSAILSHCQQEHSAAAYRRYLSSGGAAWLAETAVGETPVGFALVGETSLPGSDPDGSDLELKRIYALSRFHGSGIGAALVERAILHARQRRARRLLLGVYAGNGRAMRFYQKQGFERIADRSFQVGDRYYDDVVFAKALA